MDALAGYSYVRAAMPRGARIITRERGEGVEYTAHTALDLMAVRAVISWETLVLDDVQRVRLIAESMARKWVADVPQPREQAPTTGKYLLGHPDDLETMQAGAITSGLPYMLSRYAQRGDVLIFDADAMNEWLTDTRLDLYRSFGGTGPNTIRLSGLTS